MVPAALFLLTFIAYPVLSTIFLSFGIELGVSANPTLENYANVLTSKDTINLEGFPKFPPLGTLVHNAIWIAIHLPITLFFGLFLALILRDVKGASIVKGTIFLGMVTPLVAGAIIIRYLFSGGVGLIPAFFEWLGIEALSGSWMAEPDIVLFGLIFGSIWLWTGFSLIVYSAGLTTIPKDYFEAAQIDGASRWRIFTRIVFPLLKPITLVVVTMTVLWNLKVFDIVIAAVGQAGGPAQAADVLALQMYRTAFRALDFPAAAAVAVILTLLTLVATAWLIRRLSSR